MTLNITATIITLNEENNITECIQSLKRVCNEIIVVDSESTDNTVNIAKSLGAKVYIQTYLGDGPQKHFGVQYATHDWLLSMDADERLDEDMVADILALDMSSQPEDAYAFRRKNYVGKRWIKAGGWYPDSVIRLYNKHSAKYVAKKSHAYVEAEHIGFLHSHILHYTYTDYSHWIERINKLSSRDAWAMYDRGVKPSKIAPSLHAFSAFVRKYFFKGGIFQGLDGATVTMSSVFHTYMKYLKLVELHENKK